MTEVDARPALWLVQAGKGSQWNPAQLQGKVTVVTFFATWCFPCLGQLELLEDYQEKLGPRGLQVVGVGMDVEGAKMLDPFAISDPKPYPLLVADEDLRKGETPFGRIPVLPSTFLLDRRGRIVQGWPGLPDAEVLRAAIERQL